MHPDCQDNDPSIEDSELLYRRIAKEQVDETGKILHGALEDLKFSVEVGSKSTPKECLAHLYPETIGNSGIVEKKSKKLLEKGWKVAAITAKIPRQYDQTVYLESDIWVKGKQLKNEAHALICGEKKDLTLFILSENLRVVLSEKI